MGTVQKHVGKYLPDKALLGDEGGNQSEIKGQHWGPAAEASDRVYDNTALGKDLNGEHDYINQNELKNPSAESRTRISIHR